LILICDAISSDKKKKKQKKLREDDKMAKGHGLALALGVAVIGGSAAALLGGVGIAAEGGLSQQAVQGVIQQQDRTETIHWHDTKISAPRRLTAPEAARYHLAAGTTYYPVEVAYSRPAGGDVDASYLFYQDGAGTWAAKPDSATR
jgi:hypothetical protein